MGIYVRRKGFRRSITDALNEAEEDHYLDCPNAEPLSRGAATFLDILFLIVLFYGINLIINAAAITLRISQVNYSILNAIKFALVSTCVYVYIWSVRALGGSPAKILMGLRIINVHSGRRLSYARAIIRELIAKPLSILCIIGILLPLIRKDGHALHDLMVGSVVKRVLGDP